MNTVGVPPLLHELIEDPTLETADAAASAALRPLEAAWSLWPKRGALAPRSAFDPVDFPKLLPRMLLLEFSGRPNRYRSYDGFYRYVGSAVAELFRAGGLTGTYVSAMSDPFPERWFGVYDRLIAGRRPLAVRGRPYLVGKSFMRFEMLLLPLCRNEDAEGRDVAFSLSCVQEQPI
ncbi:MAG TPA: hypothetical protein VHA35_03670 [Dongiaceae bacterium]|jgi:hypothetical protein|nr:hypothetical protein [Dongiaceae bacterium]